VLQARADRRKRQSLPKRYWLWALVCVGAATIVWWKVEEGELNGMRNELLGKQRAVVAELGPRWLPLRDKIEKWTIECGEEALVDLVDEELKQRTWNFRDQAGIYLRLALPASKNVKTIREAANKSLRDAFTTCLSTVENPSQLGGIECVSTANCPRGQFCNEFKHCAVHSQPYNLRLAYKSLFVMGDEWVANVQAISSKLEMRGAEATFEDINKYDLPAAAELLTLSKYFIVVVDEPVEADQDDVEETLPKVADAGAQDDRSIPTASHPARVCVWRLEDDKKMLALRRLAAGALRGPGTPNIGFETRIAQQRQANSCGLAFAVREALGGDKPVQEPDDGGAGGGGDGAGGSK
jgi:hypothetical protein